MPSDKRNSIMAIATALISSLFNVALSQDVPFCQLQQPQCLHHFYQMLPFFSFELYSFLHCRVGDNFQYVHYGFSARLGELAGELLTLFLAWNVAQHV